MTDPAELGVDLKTSGAPVQGYGCRQRPCIFFNHIVLERRRVALVESSLNIELWLKPSCEYNKP